MRSTASQGGSDRTNWIDVAKALCIVLVVIMHSTLGYQNALGDVGFLDPIVAFFTPFRIPTFFVLSGLFLQRALDRDLRSFAQGRLAHLAYFYILWLLVLVAAKEGSALLMDPAALARSLLWALIEPYGSLWFIHLLAVFSLVAYACRRVDPLVLLAAAALLAILDIQTGSTLIDEFADRSVYFAAGWALAPVFFAAQRFAFDRPWAAAGMVGAFVLANTAVVFGSSLVGQPLVDIALGLSGALAMTIVAARLAELPTAGPILAAIGRRSLAIYVAFTLPMAAVRLGLLRMGVLDDGWIAIGMGSALIAGAAIVVPLLIERLTRGTPLAFLFERPRAARAVAIVAGERGTRRFPIQVGLHRA